MSDAILERLAKATEGILAHLQKSPVFGLPTGGATPPKPSTAGGVPDDAAKKAAKDAAAKRAADDKAKATAAAAAAANKASAGAGKGKRTIEQVREMIRKVAADANLGKQSAKDILADDGGGVEKVLDLKPEFYDRVYEACEVLLKGEGGKADAGTEAEEDDFA